MRLCLRIALTAVHDKAKELRPLEKHRNLSILVAMFVSFSLSLAYLYWRGRPDQARSAPPSLMVPADMRPAAIGLPRLAGAPMPAPVPQAQATLARPRLPQPEVAESGNARPDEPVPALLMIAKRGGRSEGILRNQRDDELQVTISEVNSEAGQVSQIQVTLGPGESRNIGADDGLEMRWHDHLVVHAAGFSDRQSLIP